MTYKQYTHELVIKNSKEFLYNAVVTCRTGNTSIIEVNSCAESTARSLGEKRQIVIPGLINLHCHLQHSELEIPSQKLFPWLKELVKRNYNIHQMGELKAPNDSAILGAKEALSFGTTFIVDNSDNPTACFKALSENGLRGLIGLEIFASDPTLSLRGFEEAVAILSAVNSVYSRGIASASPRNDKGVSEAKISFCLSPHAAYDVSPELWKLILEYSKKNNLKVLSHIAESTAEEAWFKDKDSEEAKEAREFWQSINTLDIKLKNWQAYKSSIDFMKQNNLLDPSLILAHAVHASREDLQELATQKVSLVTCPRSNIYLENGLPDYAAWEELGLNYGVGTDSKASNYDLDLRKELEKISNLSPERKFELVTSSAAKILGLEKKLGSLEPGKEADYVVLEILNDELDLESINPYELALDTKLTRVKEVWIAGKQCL